jgi:hypothetical protein
MNNAENRTYCSLPIWTKEHKQNKTRQSISKISINEDGDLEIKK